MPAKYLTAILFDASGKPYKYHNIKDSLFHKEKFLKFAKSEHNGVYVNWYDKESKQFIERSNIS